MIRTFSAGSSTARSWIWRCRKKRLRIGVSQPNAVSDGLFERMKQHWSGAQIVEITAAVALNGFLNR
jgi:hypothetical protein